MIYDSITIEPDEETELLDRCYQYKCDGPLRLHL